MNPQIRRWLFVSLVLVLAACSQADPPAAAPPVVGVLAVQAAAAAPAATAYVGTLAGEVEVDLAFKLGGRVALAGPRSGEDWRDGDPVTAGQVIARIDTAELVETVRAAEARAINDAALYERGAGLVAGQQISPQDFDRLTAQRDASAADLRRAQALLDDAVLKAPFSGTILRRGIRAGETVAAGQTVVRLADLKRMALDLPVTGRTDDPKFSVWGVVWQMVKNLFVKAATSPFSLLSSLIGSGEDINVVSFQPGTSRLAPAEAEKLRKLAKVLGDRPGIRLEVAGFVQRETDGEGYRQELLTRKLKGEKYRLLLKEKRAVEGQTADGVEITPEEYPKLLKSVYEKEKFPKPRTIVGTLKSLPDAEMVKLILTNSVVGEEQFKSLAHDRCLTVIGFLAAEGKLPQERMYEIVKDIHLPPQGKGGTGGRVELGIVAK